MTPALAGSWVDMRCILLNWFSVFPQQLKTCKEPIELSSFERKKNTFEKHFELMLHALLMVEYLLLTR